MFVTAQDIPGIRRDDECMATIMFAVQILLRNQDMTTAAYLARRRADKESESVFRTSLRGAALYPPPDGVHANTPTTATVARPGAECSSLEDRLQKLERLMASKRSSSCDKSSERQGEKRRGEAKSKRSRILIRPPSAPPSAHTCNTAPALPLQMHSQLPTRLFSHRRDHTPAPPCDLVQVDVPDQIQRQDPPAQTLKHVLNVSQERIRSEHPTLRPDEREGEKQRQWQRQTELEQERPGERGREWAKTGGREKRNKDTTTSASQRQSLTASGDVARQADAGQELNLENQCASLRRELEAAMREKTHLQQGMEATSEECRMLHQELLARDEECATSKENLRLAVHGHKMALQAHAETVCYVCMSVCLCACSHACLCIRVVCEAHASLSSLIGSLARLL
jgi:hypothetical protein